MDIAATLESRGTTLNMVKSIAAELDIPFTVGGGVNNITAVEQLLKSGADKVAVNSAALRRPDLLNELSTAFGSQCIVIAVDAKKIGNSWIVYEAGGTKQTKRNLFDWGKEAEDRGVGELLFTSMSNDGVKKGFAISAIKKLSEQLKIPIIASGGAGKIKDFITVFKEGKADAALAASVFHFGEINLQELKKELKNNKINIRY